MAVDTETLMAAMMATTPTTEREGGEGKMALGRYNNRRECFGIIMVPNSKIAAQSGEKKQSRVIS